MTMSIPLLFSKETVTHCGRSTPISIQKSNKMLVGKILIKSFTIKMTKVTFISSFNHFCTIIRSSLLGLFTSGHTQEITLISILTSFTKNNLLKSLMKPNKSLISIIKFIRPSVASAQSPLNWLFLSHLSLTKSDSYSSSAPVSNLHIKRLEWEW